MKSLKISRWLHKYLGLVLLLFLAWMSLSGILLNHPNLIQNVSVHRIFVPKQYQPNNWNRSSLKGIEYMGDSLLLYGRQGVYLSHDNGHTFKPFMKGEFPTSAWGKRTNQLFYRQENELLLSATNQGCLQYDFGKNTWRKVALPEEEEPIQKILLTDKHLLLISKSNVYQSLQDIDDLQFTKLDLKKKIYSSEISLIQMFFELHDGSIWGLPGRLLWDIGGLVLFFLCVSAFYIWYYPKKWKRRYKKKGRRSSYEERNARNFFFKYHKKLGWYFAVLLVIITFTGMFLNPILMMTLVNGSIDSKYYPSFKDENPWNHKIRNALYDTQNGELVLDCSDGVWAGQYDDDDEEFKKIKLPVRIFGMGTTVFEEEEPGVWLVGSFGGLHRLCRATGNVQKILQTKGDDQSGRPASTFVTGYQKLPDGKCYILGHYKGICNEKGEQLNILPMPEYIRNNSKLPLWNYMFELHNARIFRGGIGAFYILIIPLAGFLSLLMLLAGAFDYWFPKRRKSKNTRNKIKGF